jgi:hypothetical protein
MELQERSFSKNWSKWDKFVMKLSLLKDQVET